MTNSRTTARSFVLDEIPRVWNVIPRFRALVDSSTTPEGCWPYTGRITRFGYGSFTLQSPGPACNPAYPRTLRSHRLAFLIEYGYLPPDLFVLHTCRALACCRPDHLYLGTNWGSEHWEWKGNEALPDVKRQRAQRLYPTIKECADCGAPATDRHHIDGDTGHNTPDNIALLCRRCHMQRDGRLERLRAACLAYHALPKPLTFCAVCGRPAKPLRKGRCSSCYMYWYRYGQDRPLPTEIPCVDGARR